MKLPLLKDIINEALIYYKSHLRSEKKLRKEWSTELYPDAKLQWKTYIDTLRQKGWKVNFGVDYSDLKNKIYWIECEKVIEKTHSYN